MWKVANMDKDLRVADACCFGGGHVASKGLGERKYIDIGYT
jgi:hypothetical protein